ncbi:Protein of unknown function [Marinobacter daqiaonensis]|uniref:DUF2795 domain-containing protein n=1 Tax=Marinobacter daqiaonensis TaxID=650891 RepID=A0A1I6I4S9_9GAMM|nr:DUF2795 domain-containing protein [Marinobacter daqiaonensis]SFR61711.1 Protein of unknown function [Marinobacter daqiaonensis]
MATSDPEKRVDTQAHDAIAGLEFPASRDELVEQARAHGADPRIIDTLEHIPEGTYFSSEDVLKDLGEG